MWAPPCGATLALPDSPQPASLPTTPVSRTSLPNRYVPGVLAHTHLLSQRALAQQVPRLQPEAAPVGQERCPAVVALQAAPPAAGHRSADPRAAVPAPRPA